MPVSDAQLHSALHDPFRQSDLPLQGVQRGKVRDIYPISPGKLLLVTTDRLSAFDRVLGLMPFKGQVLNQLAAWWFEQTRNMMPNHLISVVDPNAMTVFKAKPIMIEVIVRGYITGITSTALWTRYAAGERSIYGYKLPNGLRKNQALPMPIITPTTKGGASGHDERLAYKEVVQRGYLDEATWDQVAHAALSVFTRGQRLARKAGLILVDTKYEFGLMPDGQVVLIDEIHTPDSSRFWLADSYEAKIAAGQEPDNYDKEFLRLEFNKRGYSGDGTPPPVEDALWIEAARRYIDLFERLTGEAFVPASYPVNERLLEVVQDLT